MEIVDPQVEYWKQEDPINHVAKIAHTCYASPDRGHEANEKFYKTLLQKGHNSPLRHLTYYYRADLHIYDDEHLIRLLESYMSCPYCEIQWEIGGRNREIYWIVANGQFLFDNELFEAQIHSFQVSEDEFIKEKPEMRRFTFCLTTQISTSRELNRTTMAIMESSTRYIKFGGKVEPSIVRPWWFDKDYDPKESHIPTKEGFYINSCKEAFDNYEMALITWQMKPEDARGILPLDTMTKVIYTGSFKEWKHCIDLRYHNTTGKAHGNANVIIGMVRDKLIEMGYEC